jgi:hypothetical protein
VTMLADAECHSATAAVEDLIYFARWYTEVTVPELKVTVAGKNGPIRTRRPH